MRKNIFTLTAIAFMLVLGACSNDEVAIVEEETKQEAESFTISVVASLPDDQTPSVSAYGFDESPTTRVALKDSESESAVKVEWRNGDEIRILVEQNGNIYYVQDGNLTFITPDDGNKKRGLFDIKLNPLGDWYSRNNNSVPFDKKASFTIHGVYTDSQSQLDQLGRVSIPKYGTEYSNLAELGSIGGIMLYFSYEHKAISENTDDLGITVKFKHIGSLFRINLKNTGSSTINVNQTRIVGVGNDPANLWAYNNNNNELKFNFITGKFENDISLDNYIKIRNPVDNIPAGGTQVLWRWHPIDGKEWPAIGIELYKDGDSKATYGNTKKANKALQVGQVYNFYATVKDDNKVYFTDSNYIIVN